MYALIEVVDRMVRKRHVNATTTEQMRAFIQESQMSVAQLSKVLNVSETTVRKWKQRKSVEDISSKALHLQTTMTPIQEWVVVQLRVQLQLSLDPLLETVKQHINTNVSRSALDRCLRRHGVSRLSDVKARYSNDLSTNKISKSTQVPSPLDEMGDRFVSVTVNRVPDFETNDSDAVKEKYLLVATEKSGQWVYIDIFEDDIVEAAGRYMLNALETAPFKLRKTLVKNYREFLAKYNCITEHVNNQQKLAR